MTASKGVGVPGPPKKPTELAILHGDKASRVNRREPKPSGRVECPPDLSDEARRIWERLAPTLIGCRVLTPADVEAFTELCTLLPVVRGALARVRLELTGELVIAQGQASPTTAYAKVHAIVMSLFARFGLTPADRARLIVGEAPSGASSDDLLTG